jgi:hypothetical protein
MFRDIPIGYITINDLDTDSNEYLPGDFVRVTLRASINGDASLRGGDVTFKLLQGDVELNAYTKSGLKTDMNGELEYIFTLNEAIELSTYTISMNVTKAGTDEYAEIEGEIRVVEKRSMSAVWELDKPQYYSGDPVTVTYQVFREGTTVSPINCLYQVSSWTNTITVGTSSTGAFTFNIPDDFDGSLNVMMKMTDSEGNYILDSINIWVQKAGFMLQPSDDTYRAGDNIGIGYETVGMIPENTQFYYRITDENGVIVQKESLTSGIGEIQFKVPEGEVSEFFDITCYMTDQNGKEIARDSVTISKMKGYLITFSLDKETYKPGETAKLSYKIISLDGTPIPEEFTLKYGYVGGQEKTLATSDPEGKLLVEIPEDSKDGTGHFTVYSNSLGIDEDEGSIQEANIRANPNPLSDSAFADISNLELILLLLLIICLILALLSFRTSRKAMKESKLPPWKKDRPLPEPMDMRHDEMGPGPSTPPEPGQPDPYEPGPQTPPGDQPPMPPQDGQPPPPQV